MVVKNLYLSCDPYMRIRMTRVEGPNVFTSYTPVSVSSLSLSLSLCFLGFTSSMLGTTVGIWIIIAVILIE